MTTILYILFVLLASVILAIIMQFFAQLAFAFILWDITEFTDINYQMFRGAIIIALSIVTFATLAIKYAP